MTSPKTPTDREKIEKYESFLHKLDLCASVACDPVAVKELIENASNWSYAHRIGNGELPEQEQQKHIDSSFWRLSDTPKSDKRSHETWLKQDALQQKFDFF